MTHRDDREFITSHLRQYAIYDAKLAEFIDHLTTVWPCREMIHIDARVSRELFDNFLESVISDMHRELELKARGKIIISRKITWTGDFQAYGLTGRLVGICIPAMPGHEATTEPEFGNVSGLASERLRQRFDIPLSSIEGYDSDEEQPTMDGVRTRPNSPYPLDGLLGRIDALTEGERPRLHNG